MRTFLFSSFVKGKTAEIGTGGQRWVDVETLQRKRKPEIVKRRQGELEQEVKMEIMYAGFSSERK